MNVLSQLIIVLALGSTSLLYTTAHLYLSIPECFCL